MRILLLAPSLEAGGAERQLVVLANGLAARGHRVCVALFRMTGPLLSDISRQVVVHDLRKGGRADVIGLLLRLRRLLRSESPDVLYTFLGVPNLAGVVMKLLVPGTCCLVSVRASNMDMARYGTLARLCGMAETRLVRFADRIVSNSHAGAESAVARGMPRRTMTVVPNGIDVDLFHPDRAAGAALRRQWGAGEGTLLVGLIGRIDPMKDHETFVRAARIVADQDARVRFVCVGDNRNSLGARVRELSDGLGLGGRLVWVGRRDDMVSVYNSLDVCCLSSAFGEGFPNVLGEAMACSVPCVTTDVGDAALIVGDTGIVVPLGNPKALAAGILSMGGRIRRGEVAGVRERIKEGFSVEAMVDATERLMGELACRV
ncbi:glycosyl transferase group 1 [Pseudodesulfovibrio aespoeensis Aspo-2]|uniref:Glycosyl transferase group 1 n=2 Tax=Pseudodesulfovibrio aespoeensis TaxID=182210 RepID=E6VZM0_PSEA9|nr:MULTISPECIES: glycosyltransferase [Pseudodesulfovibrio]ADU61734.1 glycosyl transferase group 1 [Pseudodesulfovibrio aespoeensis Aspo-2]